MHSGYGKKLQSGLSLAIRLKRGCPVKNIAKCMNCLFGSLAGVVEK
ncbi:hypothetical protein EDC14_101936 [Hydrogenispora ethanolica]|jgi:hypothetical protein|uniref:Uncharacterized protein n=1 Tax=Hydrogenispora ethanolica TaxID=1082276 RepID=A0A4R1RF10_HYDET|nr:hypothetical protein EDC14_101936 [Hydrogenispora ethanolica]